MRLCFNAAPTSGLAKGCYSLAPEATILALQTALESVAQVVQPWLYFNIILRNSQIFLPVLDQACCPAPHTCVCVCVCV